MPCSSHLIPRHTLILGHTWGSCIIRAYAAAHTKTCALLAFCSQYDRHCNAAEEYEAVPQPGKQRHCTSWRTVHV